MNRATTPPAPPSGSGNSYGVPVTIRSQPDLPKSDTVMPIRVGGGNAGGSGVRPTGTVDSYDLITFTPRQGDTYATLAKQVYGSETYASAAQAYLQDYDPRLASLRPGVPLSLPPAEMLQRKFGQHLPNGASLVARKDEPVGKDKAAAAPQADPRRTPNQLIPNPGTTREQADAKWAQPGDVKSGDLRYSVRKNDTLYLIAKRTLGNGDRWADIYNLNKDLLRGGVEVEVGMVLRMPADARLEP